MFQATARYETANGRKYLTQLCKHWAHKLDVSYEDDHGEVGFSFGKAIMNSDPAGLDVRMEVNDKADLDKAKAVLEDHLMRFAFREPVQKLDWKE